MKILVLMSNNCGLKLQHISSKRDIFQEKNVAQEMLPSSTYKLPALETLAGPKICRFHQLHCNDEATRLLDNESADIHTQI